MNFSSCLSSSMQVWDLQNGASPCCMPVLFLAAFSVKSGKFPSKSEGEGMSSSLLWPGYLSGENTIWGFPQAVCMIPKGATHKDFKGILGPGEEMKSSPLPSALCVHQSGNQWPRLTGDSRCVQEGPISKSQGNAFSKTQIRGSPLICNSQTA